MDEDPFEFEHRFPALMVRGLSRRYGEEVAVRDLSHRIGLLIAPNAPEDDPHCVIDDRIVGIDLDGLPEVRQSVVCILLEPKQITGGGVSLSKGRIKSH